MASTPYTGTLSAREPCDRKAIERDFSTMLDTSAMRYPSISVAQSLDLDLGGSPLTLRAWPTAYTDSALMVHDQRTRTSIALDLLWVHHLPVEDGRLSGWLCVVAVLSSMSGTL